MEGLKNKEESKIRMIWKRGVARQLEDGRKALTPKMHFNLTQSELGNHYSH